MGSGKAGDMTERSDEDKDALELLRGFVFERVLNEGTPSPALHGHHTCSERGL